MTNSNRRPPFHTTIDINLDCPLDGLTLTESVKTPDTGHKFRWPGSASSIEEAVSSLKTPNTPVFPLKANATKKKARVTVRELVRPLIGTASHVNAAGAAIAEPVVPTPAPYVSSVVAILDWLNDIPDPIGEWHVITDAAPVALAAVSSEAAARSLQRRHAVDFIRHCRIWRAHRQRIEQEAERQREEELTESERYWLQFFEEHLDLFYR